MPKRKDPYVVLGIPRGADIAEIKRAYRRLVLAFHPDQCADVDAADRFREVQRAYDSINEPPVLQHPRPSRPPPEPVERIHDPEPFGYSSWRHAMRFHPEPLSSRHAHRTFRHRHAFAFVDEVFGGVVPEVLPSRPPSVPKDLFVELDLRPDEAREGGVWSLRVPVHRECKACLGSGLGSLHRFCSFCGGQGVHTSEREIELVVPAGVHHGQRTRIELETSGGAVVLEVSVHVGNAPRR